MAHRPPNPRLRRAEPRDRRRQRGERAALTPPTAAAPPAWMAAVYKRRAGNDAVVTCSSGSGKAPPAPGRAQRGAPELRGLLADERHERLRARRLSFEADPDAPVRGLDQLLIDEIPRSEPVKSSSDDIPYAAIPKADFATHCSGQRRRRITAASGAAAGQLGQGPQFRCLPLPGVAAAIVSSTSAASLESPTWSVIGVISTVTGLVGPATSAEGGLPRHSAGKDGERDNVARGPRKTTARRWNPAKSSRRILAPAPREPLSRVDCYPPPRIQFRSVGVNRTELRFGVPVNGQACVLLPALDRSDVALKKRSNFFPRIQARAGRRRRLGRRRSCVGGHL